VSDVCMPGLVSPCRAGGIGNGFRRATHLTSLLLVSDRNQLTGVPLTRARRSARKPGRAHFAALQAGDVLAAGETRSAAVPRAKTAAGVYEE